MEVNSAKTGSLADAPSADADIAKAELRSPKLQPTSEELSSALSDDVSPAAFAETLDKREVSGILPKLNAGRQSVQPVRPPVMGGHLGSWMATKDASLTGPRITFSIEI